jgi:hypothetical protein
LSVEIDGAIRVYGDDRSVGRFLLLRFHRFQAIWARQTVETLVQSGLTFCGILPGFHQPIALLIQTRLTVVFGVTQFGSPTLTFVLLMRNLWQPMKTNRIPRPMKKSPWPTVPATMPIR